MASTKVAIAMTAVQHDPTAIQSPVFILASFRSEVGWVAKQCNGFRLSSPSVQLYDMRRNHLEAIDRQIFCAYPVPRLNTLLVRWRLVMPTVTSIRTVFAVPRVP